MIDESVIARFLEPTSYLRDHLSFYIDAFVDFYGEQYRSLIEEKLSNLHIIAYQKDDDLREVLSFLESIHGEKMCRQLYGVYYDFLDANKETEIRLLQKYNKEFASRIRHFLPEKFQDNIDDYLESDYALFVFSLKNNCNDLYTLIGSFNSESIFEYFTSEMDAKLEDPEVDIFEKQVIINARRGYFEALGIDVDDSSLDKSMFDKLIPSQDVISEILRIKKEVSDAYYLECGLEMYPNCLFRREADELGLLGDFSADFALMYLRPQNNCVIPNVRRSNGVFEAFPQMIVYTGSNDDIRDEVIIHELNHVLELSLVGSLGNEVEMRSGWDSAFTIVGESSASIETERIPREYERFNEVINELLTRDIHELFWQRTGYLFGGSNPARFSSTYLYQEYIVRDFYETYKREIIQSRLTGNMQVLFDAVGKENFDKLNSLVNEDYSTFSWSLRQQLFDEINARDDTPLTRQYYSIVDRRDEVFSSMNRHFKEMVVARNSQYTINDYSSDV